MFDRSPARAVNATADFTPELRRVLARAREIVIELHADEVDTEHLVLALIDVPNSTVARLLAGLDADVPTLRAALHASAPPDARPRRRPGDDEDVPYRRRARHALEAAVGAARDAGVPAAGAEHLLLGVLGESTGRAAGILATLGITAELVAAGHAQASAPRFRISIDDASDVSIFEQIVVQVREAVATGALGGGDRLPSVRQLADELGIAPGTVARAYAELERLALVTTDGARGTRVSPWAARAPAAERRAALAALLRPAAVSAFHLGASAADLRAALDVAMRGIYGTPDQRA